MSSIPGDSTRSSHSSNGSGRSANIRLQLELMHTTALALVPLRFRSMNFGAGTFDDDRFTLFKSSEPNV